MSVESWKPRPCTEGYLARHSCRRALSAFDAWSTSYTTSLRLTDCGTPEGSGDAVTFGTLPQAARTWSRTELGVPSLNVTKASCWPSALSMLAHPVRPAPQDRPMMAVPRTGTTTRGSRCMDAAYVVGAPSTVSGRVRRMRGDPRLPCRR